MYLLIVFLPIIGSFISGFFGRFVGRKGAVLISTGCTATSAFFSVLCFYEVGLCSCPCYIHLASWMSCEMFDASWGFLFDSLTSIMCIVVTGVSSLVHIYSISYMSEDPHLSRFMSYLSFFTFCMLMLVTADNLIQVFFGWEGVGVASYLLINFWFTRLQANKSAIKALLVNRVGDIGLALGIMGIFSVFHTTDISLINSCAYLFKDTPFFFLGYEFDILTCISILLFVGCVGKSAQLGLHTWLPDAMEGPTPVSALIHAATMVTAGVFLLGRCSALFEEAPAALYFIAYLGAMTSFFAATTGLVQNDLKRVIAYSTCSQLGYMIFACGLSMYNIGVFHLMNHAFFKALLFLSAGSVIHAVSDEQDMRKMGALIQQLPLTYSMMLIGTLALIGFPFLTGFYSKDAILEGAYAHYSVKGNFSFCLGSISALCTSYYSFRLIFLTFICKAQGHKHYYSNVHDAPVIMAAPLILLAFGSIFGGYLSKDMMIGMGTCFWNGSLFVEPEHLFFVESEYIPQSIKMLPLLSGFFGCIIAYYIQMMFFDISFNITTFEKEVQSVYIFLNKRWLFDKVYNHILALPSLFIGYRITFSSLDKGCIELFGPKGIILFIQDSSRIMRKVQSGFLYHSALVMLVGITFFLSTTGSSYTFIESNLFFILSVSIILSLHLTAQTNN